MLDGDEIRRRRINARLTQGQLGVRVGVSASYISNVENETGTSKLTRDLRRRIELALQQAEGRLPSHTEAAFALGRKIERLRDTELVELLIFATQKLEDRGAA